MHLLCTIYRMYITNTWTKSQKLIIKPFEYNVERPITSVVYIHQTHSHTPIHKCIQEQQKFCQKEKITSKCIVIKPNDNTYKLHSHTGSFLFQVSIRVNARESCSRLRPRLPGILVVLWLIIHKSKREKGRNRMVGYSSDAAANIPGHTGKTGYLLSLYLSLSLSYTLYLLEV